MSNINLSHVQKLVNTAVTNCMNVEQIAYSVSHAKGYEKLDQQQRNDLSELVKTLVAQHSNYEFVQEHVNSKILMLNKGRDVLLFNEATLTTTPSDMQIIHNILNKKLISHNFMACIETYNPRQKSILSKQGPATYYNSYRPPFWLHDHFYYGVPVPQCDLPEVYKDFLTHFTANDEQSYNYVLKWSAFSLKNKNDTALSLIGKVGVGKGLYSEILARVHGYEPSAPNNNYGTKAGNQMESQFNSEFANKTLVQIDEFSMRSAKAEDVFKQLTNNTLTIEKKGVDARAEQNYANIIITSNRIEHVRLSPDDRRFSFVDITETKVFENVALIAKYGPNFINEHLYSPANIAAFGAYLWHFADTLQADQMKQPFTSRKLVEVRKTGLNEWEKEFLASYIREYADKEVPYIQVRADLERDLNTKFKFMNAESFNKLLDKVRPIMGKSSKHELFTVARPRNTKGKRSYTIKMAPLDKQPEETFFEQFEVSEEQNET